MDAIRILHRHEAPHRWFFSSPDVPELVGSERSFASAQTRAEKAAAFAVKCNAEEHGQPAPDVASLEYVHFVRDTEVADITPWTGTPPGPPT
jgi:hypothetical protein